MPRGGSKPGERRGGRQKGTPNKLTAATREVFLAVLEKLAPKLEAALSATLDSDPVRGAELLLKLSERFIPVLSRRQVDVANEYRITLEDLVPKRNSRPITPVEKRQLPVDFDSSSERDTDGAQRRA